MRLSQAESEVVRASCVSCRASRPSNTITVRINGRSDFPFHLPVFGPLCYQHQGAGIARNIWRGLAADDFEARILDDYSVDLLHFVLPAKDDGVRVDLLEVLVNPVDQFLFAGDADASQHASRHFAIQLGAVFRRKDELESLRVEAQPSFRLF